MKQKIIIRLGRSFDKTEREYLVCFPQEMANIGRINYVPLNESLDRTAGCYAEMGMTAFYSYRIVHKSDPIADKVVKAMKALFDEDVEVVERLGRPTFERDWSVWSWLN